MVKELRQKLPQIKEEAAILSYNDLLHCLHKIARNARTERLQTRLRSRYGVALIDEFSAGHGSDSMVGFLFTVCGTHFQRSAEGHLGLGRRSKRPSIDSAAPIWARTWQRQRLPIQQIFD